MTPVQEAKHFQALYEISSTIKSLRNTEELLERVMDIAMEHLAAERGFLLLRSPAEKDKSDFTVRVARNIAHESVTDQKQVSTSVVNTVLTRGEPVLSFDALDDARFDDSRSIMTQQIRSVACVPLRIREKLIGAIYVDSRTARGRFTEESLDFLSAFANLAAIALENAQLYENLQAENKHLRNEVQRMYSFEGIIGKSRGTAQRSPRRSSKVNCSGIRKVRLPEPSVTKEGSLKQLMVGQFSLTRLPIFHLQCRQSCSAFFKSAKYDALEKLRNVPSTYE